ncbi:MAG: hypothetical protein AVDCRST_MAG59-2718 [uncultured Thermomicrobiales bacterium]|uniref:Uncharacterized protein n=1 Tax=uncultured Thermomicrobiales bacterium TaxID=1645740 RepID=A0A6J4UWR4_9BACT|nr:MAG: hypothetical protein AVDCRST_MAG59-2718 [uncultured Thermomicrobiales bacterium]
MAATSADLIGEAEGWIENVPEPQVGLEVSGGAKQVDLG